MKDFAMLKVLDRFRWLFVRSGVDYPVMRRILQVKLTMDMRRIPVMLGSTAGRQDPQKAEGPNYFVRSLWLYAICGVIMVPFVLVGSHYMFQMSFVFGMMLFMIMTTLISDFSSVLLDLRDKNVLYTRPVDRKTAGWAKAVHVWIYLFKLTAAIAGPALIAGLIRHGPGFALLFAVNTVLSVALVLVLTALLYLLVLKLFDGEKLKDMINYVQIGLSIFLAVGYQLIGRAFSLEELSIGFTPDWWQGFIFPIWYGATFEWLLNGNGTVPLILLSLAAWIVPVISLAAYAKLMPAFERNLQKLSEHRAAGRSRLQSWSERAACAVCRNREERTFFRFAVKMMGNEREFKLKVYPSLGMSLALPFLVMFNVFRNGGMEAVASSRLYVTVYMTGILIPTVIMMLKYSGRYKGAWIFRTAPLADLSPYYRGTLKAFAVRLLLPVYLLAGTAFILIFGWGVFPHLAAAFLGMLLYTVLCHLMSEKELPFSVPFEAAKQSDGWKTLPLLLLIAVFAGVHFGVSYIPFGVYGYGLFLLLLNVLVWRLGFRPGRTG